MAVVWPSERHETILRWSWKLFCRKWCRWILHAEREQARQRARDAEREAEREAAGLWDAHQRLHGSR